MARKRFWRGNFLYAQNPALGSPGFKRFRPIVRDKNGVLRRLSNDEIARYSRHLILPEVGLEGQQKLKAAKVLCVGTGGLGSPLAFYLAAAGIGISTTSATLIQLWFRTQARRKHFRRRQTSSRVATFAEAFSSIAWAAAAGLAANGKWQAGIVVAIALGILFGARAVAPKR